MLLDFYHPAVSQSPWEGAYPYHQVYTQDMEHPFVAVEFDILDTQDCKSHSTHMTKACWMNTSPMPKLTDEVILDKITDLKFQVEITNPSVWVNIV